MSMQTTIDLLFQILERGGAAIPMWGPIVQLVIGSLPKYKQEFTPEIVAQIVAEKIAKIDELSAERDRLKGTSDDEDESGDDGTEE